ncbi:hypothetical protein V5F79_24975 [Xanthobacter flavus]|uniref:hypothetical protein n=1 Tax=Xanthobacter flavus TaxID=281 RepID=UPI003727F41D
MSITRLSTINMSKCAVIAVACLFGVRDASAGGSENIETILTKAFFIQNITIYCSQFTPKIIENSSGKYGDISRLAYHIRQEVVSELPADQSIFVVRRSADMARAGALQAVRQFYELDRDRERARIVEWCEQSATLEIAEYVEAHDEKHDAFVATIIEAKKRYNITNPK